MYTIYFLTITRYKRFESTAYSKTISSFISMTLVNCGKDTKIYTMTFIHIRLKMPLKIPMETKKFRPMYSQNLR